MKNEEIVYECVSAKLLRWLRGREKERSSLRMGCKFNVLQSTQLCPGQIERVEQQKKLKRRKEKKTASNNEYRGERKKRVSIYEAILISVITLYTMHLIGFYTAAYAFLLSRCVSFFVVVAAMFGVFGMDRNERIIGECAHSGSPLDQRSYDFAYAPRKRNQRIAYVFRIGETNKKREV